MAIAGRVVVPGDVVGSRAEFDAGAGTYERDGHIRASVVGVRTLLPPGAGGKPSTVAVVRGGGAAQPATIDVGSAVLCKVLRITPLAAYVDILLADGAPLAQPFSGLIRKENVREQEVDKVRMDECFKPGDTVLARVESLGDARSYYLSTASPELGVLAGRSDAGFPLVPVSWEEMREERGGREEDGARERRKVAHPAGTT